jgi:hypothetical protein
VLGKPSSTQIALDVVQAALVQVALTGIGVACLLLPFTSLVRAYAPGKQGIAARALYYRAWLLPAALVLFYLVVWASPAPPEIAEDASGASAPSFVVTLALLIRMIAPVLVFIAMSATARIACGLGPFMAFVVVAVPIVLMMVAEAFVGLAVTQLLPPPVDGAAAAPR